jgi:hypothetical protein
MIRRLSEMERTMAVQRLKETNERIADLEARIQRLKEIGQPTVEAERLLRLMRSRLKEIGQPTVEAERLLRLMRGSRGMMRRHVDLLTKDQA